MRACQARRLRREVLANLPPFDAAHQRGVELGLEDVRQLRVSLVDCLVVDAVASARHGAATRLRAGRLSKAHHGVGIVLPLRIAHFYQAAQRRVFVQFVALGHKTKSIGFDDLPNAHNENLQ